MSTEKETLTPEQSLDVITSMIRQAKGNMQKNSFYFLLWGWTIVVANLGVYVLLKFTDVVNPYMMFLITIIAAIISGIHSFRQGKQAVVSTHLDNIYKWLWIGFGINCFIFWFFGVKIGWQLNAVITSMCAVPTLLSGVLLKFKPLIFGGFIFWIFGALIFLVNTETQFLLAAAAVTLGYLVPGYMLRNSDKHA
jgi:hypothetical protein